MNNENRLAYLLIFPSILILATTVYYPIILTFIYSLHYYKLTDLHNKKFIGLENYVEVLSSPDFLSALGNTLFVIGIVSILGIIFSFIVALILNKKSKISNLLTAVAILPWALPPVVNGLMWKFIFYPGLGLINKVLYILNIVDEPIQWLNNRYSTLFILSIIISWRAIPFCAVVLLANMQSISKDIYEASHIDGASYLDRFRYITLPMLIPSIIIVFTNLILSSITAFDELISLVGYRVSSETLIVHNYTKTFSYFNIGYGSSITYIIMVITGLLGFLYIKLLNKERWED